MARMSLEVLFERFRESGDVGALARVFDKTAPELLAVARHLARSEAEAEDLVQATFLAVLESPGAFDSGRSLLPWLLGIVSMHARKAWTKAGRTIEPERLHERTASDPVREASSSELRKAVGAAIGALPRKYAEVVRLHLAEGCAPAEVARELGLAPGTARVQLHRGLRLLRKSLPAGLAFGATVAAMSPRGLAAVREVILEEAAKSVGTVALTTAGGSIGAAALAKKLMFFAALPVVLVGGYLVWSEGEQRALADDALDPRTAVDHVPPAMFEAGSVGPESELLPADGTLPEVAPASPGRVVEGRVVDADTGAPVARALVTFLAPAAAAGVAGVRARSDESGHFSAAGVPRGAAWLAAADGYATARGSLRGERAITVESGVAVERMGVLRLARGARIAGTVRDAAGAPVPGARLLVIAEFLGWRALAPAVAELARTDSDGHFTSAERLPYSASRYASRPGVAPGECRYWILAAGEAGLGWTSLLVHEGRELEDGVELALRRTRPLVATVRGPAGAAIVGAELWVELELAPQAGVFGYEDGRRLPLFHADLGAHLRRRTDGAGEAAFAGLPETSAYERIAVFAVADGFARTGGTLDGKARDAGRIELALARTATFSAFGRIADSAGRPIPNASVDLDGDWRTRTDAAGEFRLEGDSAETHGRLFVQAEGYRAATQALAPLAKDMRADFTLERMSARPVPGLLVGTVADRDGNAVARVEVLLRSSRAERSAWTAADGTFQVGFTGDGEHLLQVLAGADQFVLAAPTIVAAGTLRVAVVLERAPVGVARIEAVVRSADSGAIVDPDDAVVVPLADPSFTGWRRGEHGARIALEAGRVVVTDLRPGRWSLWVGVRGLGAGSAEFVVEGGVGELVPLALDIPAAGSLSGRVQRAPREWSAWPAVRVERLGPRPGPPDLGATTWCGFRYSEVVALDGDGRFAVDHLIPGVYAVLYGPDGRRGRATVHVAPGGAREVDLIAEETARVRLEFLGPQPTGPVRVRLREGATGAERTVLLHPGGSPQSRAIEVRPGPVRWIVEFKQNEFPQSTAWSAAPQSGSLELAPGETRTVAVPIAALQPTSGGHDEGN